MKTVSQGWSAIKFDKKMLNTLKNDSKSGVELQKIQHHLALHPIHLHDIKESIKDCLNEGLAKYNKTSSGIVLGYQNVKLLDDKGLIVNDSCYIHIDLLVEFFIFKPEVGKEMCGVVNRKSKSHIGVLVYDIFNVSIPKPRDDEYWSGNDVNLGQEVVFSISQINFLSHLPYIGGKLISIASDDTDDTKEINGTKSISNSKLIYEESSEESVDEIPEEIPKKKSKKDKRRKNEKEIKEENNVEDSEEESSEESVDEIPEEMPKKKSKKDKRRKNEKEIKEENNVEDSFTIHKNKKRKKGVNSKGTDKQLSSKRDQEILSEEEVPKKKKKIKEEPEEVQESDQTLSWEEMQYDLGFEDVTDKKILKELKKKKQKHAQNVEKSFSEFSLLNKVKTEEPIVHKKKTKKSRENEKYERYENEEEISSPITKKKKKRNANLT